jgi:hypothetical protein
MFLFFLSEGALLIYWNSQLFQAEVVNSFLYNRKDTETRICMMGQKIYAVVESLNL